MRSVDSRDGCKGASLNVCKKRVLYAALLGALAIVFAFALLGCGGGERTTTTLTGPGPEQTVTTQPMPTPTTEEATTTSEAPPESTTTTIVEETTTTTVAEETTTTTEKLSSAETRLSNGHVKAMGFIKKVWEQGGKRFLSIDYAEMLTGQAAIDAAIKDGQLQPGEDLPNDYYIVNSNPQLREFQVASPVAITTSTWQGKMDNPIPWEVFKSIWTDTPTDEDLIYLRDSPWWIERDGQVVVKIDEQYLP